METFKPTPNDIARAASIRAREAAFNKWLASRNSWHPEDVPAYLMPELTNEERGFAERVTFCTEPLAYGQTYGAYLSDDRKHITTWVGETLATVTAERHRRVYNTYTTNERGSFHAVGIDGRHYHGRHNGTGCHCTMRLDKHQPVKS